LQCDVVVTRDDNVVTWWHCGDSWRVHCWYSILLHVLSSRSSLLYIFMRKEVIISRHWSVCLSVCLQFYV